MEQNNNTQPFVTFGSQEETNVSNEDALKEADRLRKAEAEARLAQIRSKNQNNSTSFVTFNGEQDKGKNSKFLLLLIGNDPDDGEEYRTWEIVTGRQEAYDTIKAYIDTLDLISSTITVEVETITQRKRVIDFLLYVLETGKVEDPGFDPMDYVDGDLADEEEYEIEDPSWVNGTTILPALENIDDKESEED